MRNDKISKHIENAMKDIDGLLCELQAINSQGNGLESMIVLPMIEKAAHLQRDLNQLSSARVYGGER